jgi:DNA-binding transcriptional regulator YhcF (GntR family)
MGKKEDRLSQILALAQANTVVTYKALSDSMGVSTMTIRRDLDTLASQNVVKLIRGGAIYNQAQDTGAPSYILQTQEEVYIEEKIRIGIKAASLLNPNDTFMLDSGSTAFCFAQAIPKDTNCTIICWALNVIQELITKPSCKLIVGGAPTTPKPRCLKARKASAFCAIRGRANSFSRPAVFTKPWDHLPPLLRDGHEAGGDRIKPYKDPAHRFIEIRPRVPVLPDKHLQRRHHRHRFEDPPHYQDFILEKGIKLLLA